MDAEKSWQETLTKTNRIKEAVMTNNQIFADKWEATHDWIDWRSEEVMVLTTQVQELKSLSGLQQTALQHCQDTVVGLEETIAQLVVTVKKLEKTIC